VAISCHNYTQRLRSALYTWSSLLGAHGEIWLSKCRVPEAFRLTESATKNGGPIAQGTRLSKHG
jgi:hypothetical protein